MCKKGDRTTAFVSAGSDSEGGALRMNASSSLFSVSELIGKGDADADVGGTESCVDRVN